VSFTILLCICLSAAASGNEGGAFSGTPMVTCAQPLNVSPPWLRNDMRHQTIITPPATALPQQMITPDVNATYTHVSASVVSNELMTSADLLV
jgi:hypothetical protein